MLALSADTTHPLAPLAESISIIITKPQSPRRLQPLAEAAANDLGLLGVADIAAEQLVALGSGVKRCDLAPVPGTAGRIVSSYKSILPRASDGIWNNLGNRTKEEMEREARAFRRLQPTYAIGAALYTLTGTVPQTETARDLGVRSATAQMQQWKADGTVDAYYVAQLDLTNPGSPPLICGNTYAAYLADLVAARTAREDASIILDTKLADDLRVLLAATEGAVVLPPSIAFDIAQLLP